MCGIFGIVAGRRARVTKPDLRSLLRQMHGLSESRGKESAGLHAYLPGTRQAWTIKADIPATQLLKKPGYKAILDAFTDSEGQGKGACLETPFLLLAHSRLVTNGSSEQEGNNQPVVLDRLTMVHNGIVVNADELWARNENLSRQAEVDTEVIAALINQGISTGLSGAAATVEAYRQLRGSASIAWVHDAYSQVILATNTGDLYFIYDGERDLLLFASEKFILDEVRKIHFPTVTEQEIVWVEAGVGYAFDLAEPKGAYFSLSGASDETQLCHSIYETETSYHSAIIRSGIVRVPVSSKVDETLVRYNKDNIRGLKRCSRCVLPETFPFIEFDKDGVCNYCLGYKTKYKGVDEKEAKESFLKEVEKYRRQDGSPDVLVPFSGGRDSCYGLHLIKEEFGFNPITFTYDWGMVTDLARRNTARMCGQLGVQNILVSADIRAKRNNIRKNVSAWLKQPDLGMVPLFMAGDKQFFKIVNTLKAQTGISLDLWSANPLENTDFKSGFCGVAPDFGKKRLDYLSFDRKLKMIGYYGKRFLTNPAYINLSILDTVSAFFSYYAAPRRDFYFMFDHLIWDEQVVDEILLGKYNFERSPDSTSTWRIGDGTAPFYNYIYLTACGFTEFDTFRSNQVREGMISREEALEFVLVENQPRIPSLRWYFEAIGLDFNTVIKHVNELDKIGLHQR